MIDTTIRGDRVAAVRRYAAVERLCKAAREYLAEETEVAKMSYQDHHPGTEGPPIWNDAIWRAADPEGAKLAIELRRALREVARSFTNNTRGVE